MQLLYFLCNHAHTPKSLILFNITTEEEFDDGIPIWKRALMKKRVTEEKKKKEEEEKMVVKQSIIEHVY